MAAPSGAPAPTRTLAGIIRFAVDPRLAVHAAIADLALAPRTPAGRGELGGLLSPAAGRPGARQSPAPARRAEPRAEDRARHVQQRGARARSARAGGFRQWIPHAPRLYGGVGGLAARRAAPGRPHGAHRPGGRRGPRPISGLVRCEFRPNARGRRAAARGSLPHPASGRPPRRSRRRADGPRARRGARRGRSRGGLAVRPPRRRRRRRRITATCTSTAASSPARSTTATIAPRTRRSSGSASPRCGTPARFLRFGDAASGNPCAGSLDRAYVFGVSQSGRFLRHLLYLGLDEDEAGRSVFDGVIPHVAGARRGEFNCRFGQPSLNATESLGSLFPFTDRRADRSGHRAARAASSVASARARRGRRSSPINTSAEYWRGDASLVHTDVTGPRDVEPAPDVRVYLFAGTQHTPGTLPPPSEDAEHRRPRAPRLQRGRLRAAPARRAGEPRPLGDRGRRAAGPSAAPARRRPAVPAEATAPRLPGHARRALSRSRPAAPAAGLRARRRARHRWPRCRPRSARRT